MKWRPEYELEFDFPQSSWARTLAEIRALPEVKA